MDENQVPGKRPRRSRAEAEQLLAEFEASGLSQVEFSRIRRLGHGTLGRYRKQRRERSGESRGADRWVAVEVSSASARCESRLAIALPAGCRIEVGRGFDSGTLLQLLHVLERL